MDEKRLKGLMGICVRSGQAVFGEDGCRKAISRGECGILLLDGGASENTAKRYETQCRGKKIPFAVLPEGLLEAATGRTCMAMAVRKGPLLEQVTGCL
jgi:ribosomal protein L7Ae-like RNA K-turn-binding protein